MADEYDWGATRCDRCGRHLTDDPDDEPFDGAGGGPICGECARDRDFDAEQAFMDQADGSLDGIVEW